MLQGYYLSPRQRHRWNTLVLHLVYRTHDFFKLLLVGLFVHYLDLEIKTAKPHRAENNF